MGGRQAVPGRQDRRSRQYLSFGTHVFEIRYTIPGVLDPGSTGADKTFADSTGDDAAAPSAFFWNVIAGSWNNRMQQVDISVTLPGDVTGAQCSVGLVSVRRAAA